MTMTLRFLTSPLEFSHDIPKAIRVGLSMNREEMTNMRRRNDVYITEYMLQASLQSAKRKKTDYTRLIVGGGVALFLLALVIYFLSTLVLH
jgi:hypothetical protein